MRLCRTKVRQALLVLTSLSLLATVLIAEFMLRLEQRPDLSKEGRIHWDASLPYRDTFTVDRVLQRYAASGQGNTAANSLALQQLQQIIQAAFDKTQNPPNCDTAKQFICDLGRMSNGLGSKMHQVVFCHFVAFSLGRVLYLNNFYMDEGYRTIDEFLEPINFHCRRKPTLAGAVAISKLWTTGSFDNSPQIISYTQTMRWMRGPQLSSLPGSVPKSMASLLDRIHHNPGLWMIGQSVSYLFGRLTPSFQQRLDDLKRDYGITSPFVGIHIRHGDKIISEAVRIESVKYFERARNYFDKLKTTAHSNGTKPSIFLATDDPKAFADISAADQSRKYHIVTFPEVTNEAAHASHSRNYKRTLLKGILTDLFLLAYSDHVICTYSSNIGRLILELRQVTSPEESTVSEGVVSMDSPWSYVNTGYEHFSDKVQGYALQKCEVTPDGGQSNMLPCNYGDIVLVNRKDFRRVKDSYPYILNTTHRADQFIDVRQFAWLDHESVMFDEQLDALSLLKQ